MEDIQQTGEIGESISRIFKIDFVIEMYNHENDTKM